LSVQRSSTKKRRKKEGQGKKLFVGNGSPGSQKKGRGGGPLLRNSTTPADWRKEPLKLGGETKNRDSG